MRVQLHEAQETLVRFGAFTLDIPARTLLHGYDPVSLTHKEFDMLSALVVMRGQLVPKSEIIERCWPDEAIADSAFFQTVYRLRRALAHFDPYGEYVRTVPGRGYRFAAAVHSVDAAHAAVPNVIERLRGAIAAGLLCPGQTLRQETLSAEFGVSHIPIREALRQLEAEGLVTFIPDRGATVRLMTPREVRERLTIRTLLEPVAMRWAAQAMTPELQPKAEQAYQRVRSARHYKLLVARHWEFLETLYSAAGMPQLTQIISSLRIQTALIPDRARVRSAIVKVITQHDPLLLEACRKNDANAAERIIREQIAALEKAVAASARSNNT